MLLWRRLSAVPVCVHEERQGVRGLSPKAEGYDVNRRLFVSFERDSLSEELGKRISSTRARILERGSDESGRFGEAPIFGASAAVRCASVG